MKSKGPQVLDMLSPSQLFRLLDWLQQNPSLDLDSMEIPEHRRAIAIQCGLKNAVVAPQIVREAWIYLHGPPAADEN